jgi:hypothetical protein
MISLKTKAAISYSQRIVDQLGRTKTVNGQFKMIPTERCQASTSILCHRIAAQIMFPSSFSQKNTREYLIDNDKS